MHARLGRAPVPAEHDPAGDVVVVVVADERGEVLLGAPADAGADARAAGDAELEASGWYRTGPWAGPSGAGAGLPCVAPVRPRPRVPPTAADQRSLEALRRLTAMARGPVTAAALVPHVAPRWQVASSLLRRLVAAGQVRSVGRTVGRDPRPLYAPVGSPWAPDLRPDEVVPPRR